jgi:putative addiction module component (TIGR02574 family)
LKNAFVRYTRFGAKTWSGGASMATKLDRLERDVLRLPVRERAFLADRLLSSLGRKDVLTDVDEAWIAEAERRYKEHKAGKRKSIPAADVFREADRLLR